MRLVSMSFIVSLLVIISACSQNPGTAATEARVPPQNSDPMLLVDSCRICDQLSWLPVATPSTMEFAAEYSDYLKLPVENRQAFRSLAENEMTPYYLLRKDMAGFKYMKLHPSFYLTSARQLFNERWVGFGKALKALELATSMDPSYAEAWAAKGELALQMGALVKARQSLEIALFLTEDKQAAGFEIPLAEQLEIFRHLGWALRNLGYHEEGLVQIERALALKPQDHELLLVKGLLLALAGRTGEAIMLAVKMPAVEISDFTQDKEGLGTRKTGYCTRWIKSQALFGEGDYKGAMHVLGDVNPYQENLPHGGQYWNDVGLVAEMVQNENAGLYYGIAYANMDHRIFCPIMLPLGGSLILGYPDPTLPVFSTFGARFYVGGSHLSFISFHMNRLASGVFDKQRDISAQSALDALDVAERRNIRPLFCKALRGRIYHVQERYAEAEAELNLARDGLAAEGLVDYRTSYLLGLLALNDDRDAEAQVLLEEALEHGASDAICYRSLGLALAQQGKIPEAEAMLEKALDMDSFSVPGLFNLGLLYCKLQRFEDAVAVLEKAYALDNDNLEVQHLLQVAAATSRERGKTLHSGTRPAPPHNPDTTIAYIAKLMGELETLFSVPDSCNTRQNLAEGSAIALERYEEYPKPYNRKVLALALMDEGQRSAVQDLLSPFWNDDLDPDEVVILLYADKLEARQLRAEDLARAILKGETGTDNPYIRVLALVSLSGDEVEEAQLALSHLASNPLLGMEAMTVDHASGYWSDFLQAGFANYRLAAHVGNDELDYIKQLQDAGLQDVPEIEEAATE